MELHYENLKDKPLQFKYVYVIIIVLLYYLYCGVSYYGI